ncbi:YihY/virulence factor BrkB family protein [Thermogemmatispora sp.]|jgi:YihY family inner membrane protein|uniref:YihY/virulence factor BrkB family protein n=1 Tax=Thermogemmatispora sp. TaxID=1968838 RepID=UPI0035E423EC
MITEEVPERKQPGRGDSAAPNRLHVGKIVQRVQAFFVKFNNDWVMNLAAALAFNLLTAMAPLAVALLAIPGLLLGKAEVRTYLSQVILSIFPRMTASPELIDALLRQLNRVSGPLGIVSILIALFTGSRLFVLLEGCFGIIYRRRPRALLQQNLMALGMLLLFAVLTPLMVLAASLPALVISFLEKTPLGQIPGSGFVFSFGGLLGGLAISWVFFLTIYTFVPNRRIRWRSTWRGALLAAVLTQIYLALFSLYAARFLSGLGGQIGFAIILVTFFYYFAVILLLGAEVNAFFGEKIRSAPADLVTLVANSYSKEGSASAQPPAGPAAPPGTIASGTRDAREQSAQS